MRSAATWASAALAACLSLIAFAWGDKLARDPGDSIVITHVTVINPGTSSVQADRAVLVSGGRIVSVSDAATFQSPASARVIDATGGYLLPGLWDMHVHSAFGDWFPRG